MGEDTGERQALRRDRDALRVELDETRRHQVQARLDSLESRLATIEDRTARRHQDCDGRLDRIEKWQYGHDQKERALSRVAPRSQDQQTDLVAAPQAQHSPLSPLQQVGANAGGGGLVATILFVFGKLMGWW